MKKTPSSPSLLRRLLLGNLLVYLAAAAMLAYFYFFPPEDLLSLDAASSSSEPAAPLLQVMIPTPTAFVVAAQHVFPTQTAVPLSAITQTVATLNAASVATPSGTTSSDMTPGVMTVTVAPLPVVNDNALVPPTAINIILLGTDRRGNEVNWRTDTIILLSINQTTKTAGMLSIPRDLWVKIPGYGNERINTADFYGDYYKYPGGGQQLIKDTIERNLGIRVHYYVKVDMKVFRQAVDTLGGIDVDVDCPLVENGFVDEFGYANLNFQPGVQHMDGIAALRYSRSRYTTNDFDRGRRQRQVLVAAWDKAKQLNLITKWPELYSQFRSSVKTDLGPTEMAALAWIGSQLRFDHIKSRAIDSKNVTTPWLGPAGEMVQLANPQKLHAVLVEFFGPPSEQVDAAVAENSTIQILSGTGSQTVADIAAVNLRRQGFQVTGSGLAPQKVNASTLVVNNARPETIKRLQELYRIQPANVRTGTDPEPKVDLQVILGRDYNACSR